MEDAVGALLGHTCGLDDQPQQHAELVHQPTVDAESLQLSSGCVQPAGQDKAAEEMQETNDEEDGTDSGGDYVVTDLVSMDLPLLGVGGGLAIILVVHTS